MTYKLFRYFSFLAIFFILLSSDVFAQTSSAGSTLGSKFKLLPLPKKIVLLKGKPLSPNSLNTLSVDGIEKPPPFLPLEIVRPSEAPKGTLTLKISDATDLPESREGYILEIGNINATITARDAAGIFYGCQTLSQLLQDAKDQNINVPACRITDHPDIDYRAVHLDLKHHLDSMSYYYRLIDRLAALKVNAMIIEFEDKLKYIGAPVVAASHAIPIEDFASLSNYAKERNIEISPLIQGLGHASLS